MALVDNREQADLPYGYSKSVAAPLDEAIKLVKKELQSEGFGILSEIDVQAKLKEKLDVDFRKYVILGACNPELAYQALSQEIGIGLMLPCNVVVYEDGDGSTVAIAKPERMAEAADNEALAPIAEQADRKLRSALDRLH